MAVDNHQPASTHKPYKFIVFLSMVYICNLFASAVMGNKIIQAPIGSFSAGSLTGPLWFVLSDIIAEVYGLDVSRSLFWSAMVCEFIFVCITVSLINLPSPLWWHYQSSYDYVEGYLFRIYFCQFIGIIIGWYLNVLFITKWKETWNGRYFWLRSIGASGMGEIVFSIISVSLSTIGLAPMHELVNIVIWSCSLKIIFSILFSYPAALAVGVLKKAENIDVYDYSASFNPFKILNAFKG